MDKRIIMPFNRSDTAAWAHGETIKFQCKKLSKCRHLTAWIKFDKYLIRWMEVLWWGGAIESEMPYDLSIYEIKSLLDKYVGDKPLLEHIEEFKQWENNNRKRFWHASFEQLSKQETLNISDAEIEKRFNK